MTVTEHHEGGGWWGRGWRGGGLVTAADLAVLKTDSCRNNARKRSADVICLGLKRGVVCHGPAI